MTETPVPTQPPLSDPLAALPLFERIRLVMVNVAKITCDKCGRTWLEPLREKWFVNYYGELRLAPTARTTPRCSQCSPPPRQPQVGGTRRHSMGRGGFVQVHDRRGRDGERFSAQQRLDYLAQKNWAWDDLQYRNRESQEREKILTTDWIREYVSPDEIQRVCKLLRHADLAALSDARSGLLRPATKP